MSFINMQFAALLTVCTVALLTADLAAAAPGAPYQPFPANPAPNTGQRVINVVNKRNHLPPITLAQATLGLVVHATNRVLSASPAPADHIRQLRHRRDMRSAVFEPTRPRASAIDPASSQGSSTVFVVIGAAALAVGGAAAALTRQRTSG